MFEHHRSSGNHALRWLMWAFVGSVACTPQYFGSQVLAPPVVGEMAAGGRNGLRVVVEASRNPFGRAEEREATPSFYDSSPEANGRDSFVLDFVSAGPNRFESFVPPNSKQYEISLVARCSCQGCKCPPCQDPAGHYLRQLETREVAFWSKTVDVEIERGKIPLADGTQSFEMTLGVPKLPGSRVLPRSARLLDGARPPEELRVANRVLAEVREVLGADSVRTGVATARVTLPRETVAYGSEGPRALRLTLIGPCRDAQMCEAPAEAKVTVLDIKGSPPWQPMSDGGT